MDVSRVIRPFATILHNSALSRALLSLLEVSSRDKNKIKTFAANNELSFEWNFTSVLNGFEAVLK